MNFRRLCLTVLLGISFTVQAATEVIALDYLTADDVLATAQSVLGSEGRASVYGNQLIVSAPAEKIAELRSVIQQLDTQPRRLLITLDTSGTASDSDRGYRVDGSASAGNVEIIAGRGEINGKDQVRIINNKSTSNRWARAYHSGPPAPDPTARPSRTPSTGMSPAVSWLPPRFRATGSTSAFAATTTA
jgi:hypothetical protein